MDNTILAKIPEETLLEIYTEKITDQINSCYLLDFDEKMYVTQTFTKEGANNGFIIGKINDITKIRYDTLYLARFDFPVINYLSTFEKEIYLDVDRLLSYHLEKDRFLGLEIGEKSRVYGRIQRVENDYVFLNEYSSDYFNNGISIFCKQEIKLIEIESSEIALLEKLKYED